MKDLHVIGQKIKNLRISQNLSIEEVAQRSGLDTEILSKIEEEEIMPSLSPLIKIARSLGVRLGTFLDDQTHIGPVICKKENRSAGVNFSNNTSIQKTNMLYHSLAAMKSDRHMEPFFIEVAPSDDTIFNTSSHEGEEFIYVLEGDIEITYGLNNYILGQGDSMYYDSIVEHHVHNAGDKPAKILGVVYTPF